MRGSDNILDYKTAYKFNRFFFFFLTVKLWFIYFEISSLFCNPKSFFSIFCIFEDFFWKYWFFFKISLHILNRINLLQFSRFWNSKKTQVSSQNKKLGENKIKKYNTKEKQPTNQR